MINPTWTGTVSAVTVVALAQQLDPPNLAAAAGWTPIGVGYVVTIVIGGVMSIIGAWKLSKIEAHVNSEKTALHEQAIARDREIALLREVIEERKGDAALLAQAVSNAEAIKASTPSPPPASAASAGSTHLVP